MSLKNNNSLIRYQDYRSILCLDGTLPDPDFFQCDLPIIAADGAANTLMKMGIKPRVVVGDLDAIDPLLKDQLETVYLYDQDYSDFQQTLGYLKTQQLLPCIVVGVNGGYLDHILNNINIFMESKNVLYAPPLFGCVIDAGENRSFELTINTKISLLGIPQAQVTTRGLKWNLSNTELVFPGKTSCFNRNVDKTIHIHAHTGKILVLIYQ